MATLAVPHPAQPQTTGVRTRRSGAGFLALCTGLATGLLGYHPAAEDGGIYAAATALRLQPDLFPAERGFAVAHTAHSLFVPLLAVLLRCLHLPLAYVCLICLTLMAASFLLQQMFEDTRTRRGALLLFAVSLGVPVAGTSLYLADPYLTARSASTPLLLLALVFLLKRRGTACCLCLAAATALHPIMSVGAIPLFLTYLACSSRRPRRNLLLLALAVCGAMALLCVAAPTDSAAARAASLGRVYWFPRHWAWYEWLGLIAPVALLTLRRIALPGRNAGRLAIGTAAATIAVTLPALLLVSDSSRSFLLARLQPLRLLHLVYCVFVLLLGGWLFSLRPRWTWWAQCTALLLAGLSLLAMQRSLYPDSGHFEWPGAQPHNGWLQAFGWVRQNTPRDALFALDADYTTSRGEDAQLFRAVALRSSLPDAAKDGGIASVMPQLAAEWQTGVRAQSGLAHLSDGDRLTRLGPLGVSWIVLPADSVTAMPCPYRNAVAQVCRLP